MACQNTASASAWTTSLGSSRPVGYSIAGWMYSATAPSSSVISAPFGVGNTATYPNDAGDMNQSWGHDNASYRNASVLHIGGASYSGASVGASSGAWAHIAATYDGTTFRSYLNGVQVSANTVSQTAGQPADWMHRVFGSGGNSSSGQPFVGHLAESGYWESALTADDVSSLAKGFSPRRIRPQTLRSYYPLVSDARNHRTQVATSGTLTASPHPRIYP